MTLLALRTGILAATLAVAVLPALAPAQDGKSFTAALGIDQKLGAKVPLDATFRDETGATRTIGSLLKGRPVLIVPFPLRKTAGCGVAIDGLQKTLFRADKANERKLFKMSGPNRLEVGRQLDLAFLSLDPSETPVDAAETKNDFETKVGYDAEPLAVLTGDAANIRRVADALGFRFFHNPATGAMRNPTGSVLLTPDGRISSYTLGNDYQTKELEANLEIAQKGGIGDRAEVAQMFACVQLDAAIVARRGKIEAWITAAALTTLAVVVFWIGSMLRAERRAAKLGGTSGA